MFAMQRPMRSLHAIPDAIGTEIRNWGKSGRKDGIWNGMESVSAADVSMALGRKPESRDGVKPLRFVVKAGGLADPWGIAKKI
jgi:hypothetical protein